MNLLKCVRDTYKVPAMRGLYVTYNGQTGYITGATETGHLIIRIHRDVARLYVHPTDDKLEYPYWAGERRQLSEPQKRLLARARDGICVRQGGHDKAISIWLYEHKLLDRDEKLTKAGANALMFGFYLFKPESL